ncbi:MBL fold metallo-hydrolase [Vibrio olivae]
MSLTLTGERNPPNWRVDILDVGHGLAIIIEQQGSAYVYDTGNAWLTGSFAQDVIMPILRQRGISQLEGFIVSHLDADHAAGKSDVERFFAPKLNSPVKNCRAIKSACRVEHGDGKRSPSKYYGLNAWSTGRTMLTHASFGYRMACIVY